MENSDNLYSYCEQNVPAVRMRYTSNTHTSETAENKILDDVTFFIQNRLTNCVLNLRYKITRRLVQFMQQCISAVFFKVPFRGAFINRYLLVILFSYIPCDAMTVNRSYIRDVIFSRKLLQQFSINSVIYRDHSREQNCISYGQYLQESDCRFSDCPNSKCNFFSKKVCRIFINC